MLLWKWDQPAGASPEEGYRVDYRDEAWGKVERIEIAQPGEKKLQGDLTGAFQYLKGVCRKMERDCL